MYLRFAGMRAGKEVFHPLGTKPGTECSRILLITVGRGEEEYNRCTTNGIDKLSHQIRLKYDGAFTMNMRLLLST